MKDSDIPALLDNAIVSKESSDSDESSYNDEFGGTESTVDVIIHPPRPEYAAPTSDQTAMIATIPQGTWDTSLPEYSKPMVKCQKRRVVVCALPLRNIKKTMTKMNRM